MLVVFDADDLSDFSDRCGTKTVTAQRTVYPLPNRSRHTPCA
jgi:hypothetical protein